MTEPKFISSVLTFGKYSGRSIENIWTGQSDDTDEKIVRTYLQEFLDLFNGKAKEPYKVISNDNDLEECKSELDFLESNNIFLNVYVSKRRLIIKNTNDIYLDAIRKVIRAILSRSYRNPFKNVISPIGIEDLKFSKPSLDFITLFADPAYINWAITTIDDFCIEQEDLELLESKPSSRFVGFDLNDICEDVIEYKAVFKEFSYKLPEEAKSKNLMKFERWIDHEYNVDHRDVYDKNNSRNYEKDTFDALTDGQYGDYNDWKENNGDLDNLRDKIGF